MAKLTKKDGVIFITSLPNADSFCHNLFKGKFGLPVCAIARNGFTKDVLDQWFGNHSFRKVSEWCFYEETPYANPLDDVKKVSKAISLEEEGKEIDFSSPAFWGNQLTLVYRKNNI